MFFFANVSLLVFPLLHICINTSCIAYNKIKDIIENCYLSFLLVNKNLMNVNQKIIIVFRKNKKVLIAAVNSFYT